MFVHSELGVGNGMFLRSFFHQENPDKVYGALPIRISRGVSMKKASNNTGSSIMTIGIIFMGIAGLCAYMFSADF